MPRRKTKSVGASIAAQAQARLEVSVRHTANVIPLTDRELLHSRIDRTPDPGTGAPCIRVIIPGGTKPENYDFTQYLRQPELADLIAEGFRIWAPSVSARMRYAKHGMLLRGLASHLEKYPPNSLTTDAIDETFWTEFLRFLDAPKAGGKPWSHSTRASLLSAARVCIQALENHPFWGDKANRLIYHSGLPSNPWPGRGTKASPTEIIVPHEVDRILMACLADVVAIRNHLEQNMASLQIGQAELHEARARSEVPDFASLRICAARVHEAFPDRLASIEDLHRLDRSLGRHVQYVHGIRAVRKILYNTFDELAPFVVLIGFKTIFNPDPLLSLEWSAIEKSFDGATLIFHAEKHRSSRTQTSSHASGEVAAEVRLPAESETPMGLQDLLDVLRRLTAGTRAILPDRTDGDRLFIGTPSGGGSVGKAFRHRTGPSCDILWKQALADLIDRHSLATFTLKMIRATGADQTRRDFGIFAQQERQGHVSPQTTRSFYTSDWVRKEGQDRIGEVQELYVRAIETEGVVDPRGLDTKGQQSAATPGFTCVDPYSSPRQEQGKLCAAYGECPSCPLAVAQPRNDEAVARYLALHDAIYAAQNGRVSPVQWKEKWAPILRHLEALLQQVPKDVVESARRFRISLPPVG